MLYCGILNHRYIRFPSYINNDIWSKEKGKKFVFKKLPKNVRFPRKMFSEKRGRVLKAQN